VPLTHSSKSNSQRQVIISRRQEEQGKVVDEPGQEPHQETDPGRIEPHTTGREMDLWFR